MTWAQRLKRVFKIDILTCEDCGGAVKVLASIEDPAVIKKILDHLDRRTPPPSDPSPERHRKHNCRACRNPADGPAPVLMHERKAGQTPGMGPLTPAGQSARHFKAGNALSEAMTPLRREMSRLTAAKQRKCAR